MITRELMELAVCIVLAFVVVRVAGYIEGKFKEEMSTRNDLTVVSAIALVCALGIFGVIKIVKIFIYIFAYLKP